MKIPHETTINIIAEDTRLEGKIQFQHIARVHGVLVGEVQALEGSTLILAQTGLIEGNVEADTLWVDGFVRGDITAKSKVTISNTGRVLGSIHTPTLTVEFGAYFEGQCKMEGVKSPLHHKTDSKQEATN